MGNESSNAAKRVAPIESYLALSEFVFVGIIAHRPIFFDSLKALGGLPSPELHDMIII